MRIENCLKLMKDLNCDALLLLNESNMHYLCGFSPSEGVVLLLKNGSGYHIVDSRYTEEAECHAKETGLSAIEIANKFSDTVAELCKKNSIKTIAYENETISLKSFHTFKEATHCDFIGIDDKLMKIRNIKSNEEIEMMIKANDIAEKSFLELLNFVKTGKSEKELQAYFDYLMAKIIIFNDSLNRNSYFPAAWGSE